MEDEDSVVVTPDMLDAYLRILKDAGVVAFEGMGFAVKFAPPVELSEVAPGRRVPRSMWEDESLWPGGKPPEFHKKAP